MGIIIKSALCIGVLTAISPLNETPVEPQALRQAAAPIMANSTLVQEAAAFCAQNQTLCRDRAAILAEPVAAVAGKLVAPAPHR